MKSKSKTSNDHKLASRIIFAAMVVLAIVAIILSAVGYAHHYASVPGWIVAVLFGVSLVIQSAASDAKKKGINVAISVFVLMVFVVILIVTIYRH